MTIKKLYTSNRMRKFSIPITAVIAGLLIICTGAEGADWQYYAVTSDEDMIFYYDTDSIKRLSGSTVQVRVREIYISETLKREVIEIRTFHEGSRY